MHTREIVGPKVAVALLVAATIFAAWPRADAVTRTTAAEANEGKAPKKTKRKRPGSESNEGRVPTMWTFAGAWSPVRRVTGTTVKRKPPAEIAIETARAQIGKPYRYAATGPSSFDCSGLTRFAYAAAGVDLPHNSARQYASVERVPLSKLRKGDLVFSGPGRIGHVGIYVGEGRMIHSPHSGRHVEVAPLRDNLIGAGRPS